MRSGAEVKFADSKQMEWKLLIDVGKCLANSKAVNSYSCSPAEEKWCKMIWLMTECLER